MTKLDYSKYSLDELYDALSHIEKTKWPERVEEIKKYIKLKKTDTDLSLGKIDIENTYIEVTEDEFPKNWKKRKLIPYYYNQFSSSKTLQQAIIDIQKNTMENKTFSFIMKNQKKFRGEVGETSFRLSRNIGYRNSFLPMIEGLISSNSFRTTVQLKMFIHPFVMVFMLIWFTGVTFAFVAILYGAITGEISYLQILVPIFFYIFGLSLSNFGFWKEVNKSEIELREILE